MLYVGISINSSSRCNNWFGRSVLVEVSNVTGKDTFCQLCMEESLHMDVVCLPVKVINIMS